MRAASLQKEIHDVLRADPRLWDEDKKELNETLLLHLLEALDEKIIALLFAHDPLREKFFTQVSGVYVFAIKTFKFFIEEHKVDNSYTAYKNRIGLTDGDRFLKDSEDVVLDFPYKDCILQGGQSTEEGMDTYFAYEEGKTKTVQGKKVAVPAGYQTKQAKRKEVFFNDVLAHDEIDRLLHPKALVGWKRFTAKGEAKVHALKRSSDGTIRENMIVKGNNLLALHSLKRQFAGKVKLVYIDPPYNTKSAANTFSYNNNFNHSTWLTFVKNRVEVSKAMLRKDGFYCIAIDHYELFYVGALLDQLFGRENRVATIAVETNPGGRSDSQFFATSHEYCIIYAKNIKSAKINDLNLSEAEIEKYNLHDSISRYKLVPLRRTGSNSTPDKRPNLYFPIFFNPLNKNISLKEEKGYAKILPIGSDGVVRVWRWSKKKILQDIDNIEVKKTPNGFSVFVKDRLREGKKAKTMWYGSRYDASSHGTKLLQKLNLTFNFSYPKPINLMVDILQILTNHNDVIIDYHAGSGTTGHAVLQLNKEDGGNRKFILVEQMDYIHTVTCPRVQKVMEQEGIEDSFLYCELAEWNMEAKRHIEQADSLAALETFWDAMCARYFLHYNCKVKDFKEQVLHEEAFRKLPLEQQKSMFLAMLDLNQMYVNESEMSDAKFDIAEEDQRWTRAFYRNLGS